MNDSLQLRRSVEVCGLCALSVVAFSLVQPWTSVFGSHAAYVHDIIFPWVFLLLPALAGFVWNVRQGWIVLGFILPTLASYTLMLLSSGVQGYHDLLVLLGFTGSMLTLAFLTSTWMGREVRHAVDRWRQSARAATSNADSQKSAGWAVSVVMFVLWGIATAVLLPFSETLLKEADFARVPKIYLEQGDFFGIWTGCFLFFCLAALAAGCSGVRPLWIVAGIIAAQLLAVGPWPRWISSSILEPLFLLLPWMLAAGGAVFGRELRRRWRGRNALKR